MRQSRRTSHSDPLRIAEVPAGDAGGLIGITLCPGKRDPGHGWARNLQQDLDVVVRWNAVAVVTLIDNRELEMLGVPQLGVEVRARGIDWHHLPIEDMEPPDERFETAWLSSGPTLRRVLDAGANVLVHCRGGVGRAGTVSARILVELGATPESAVRTVRAARPGAIETNEQLRYVLELPRRPTARI